MGSLNYASLYRVQNRDCSNQPNGPGGEIGRHARLKILFPLGSAGSTPAPGTI